ncbi:Rv3654c family TadE-like protein [Streptomyces hainanensis]|uniref:Putative Flp pilus-assembly TadG-like N-terminal domain-containing protein n=1 Tax=Streptomyces hainanensis TaxID=402648 RepID=A0A4R4TTU8_9ACTN|nr:Rv3654c family TadE-like protein [Streptomyces hainanensis]TDC79404.1 hypothetical protein E1283_02800 [Streptomyces hainanensis]
MPSPADRRRPRAGDRGSGTVFAACSVAVLCLVFGVVLALGQVMAARQRAATAADLAALAAAERALSGAEAACALADRVAGRQGARLTRCQLTGEVAPPRARTRCGPAPGPGRRAPRPSGRRRPPAGPTPPGPPSSTGPPSSAG